MVVVDNTHFCGEQAEEEEEEEGEVVVVVDNTHFCGEQAEEEEEVVNTHFCCEQGEEEEKVDNTHFCGEQAEEEVDNSHFCGEEEEEEVDIFSSNSLSPPLPVFRPFFFSLLSFLTYLAPRTNLRIQRDDKKYIVIFFLTILQIGFSSSPFMNDHHQANDRSSRISPFP